MADVWMLGTTSYRKFSADDLTLNGTVNYPAGSPTVANGVAPTSDGIYVHAADTGNDVAWQARISDDQFRRVSVGDQPRGHADDGNLVWYTNDTDNTLSAVDKATWSVTATRSVASEGIIAWVDPYLWVFDLTFPSGIATSTLRVYDPNADSVVHTAVIASGSGVGVDVVAVESDYVIVGYRGVNRLDKFDATTYAVLDDLSLGQQPARIVIVNDVIYVTFSSGIQSITSIDADTMSTTGTLLGGYSELVTNDFDSLYSTIPSTNTLQKIDISNLSVVETVTGLGSVGTLVYAGAAYSPTGWVVGSVGW